MALDGNAATEVSGRAGPLHAVLSSAIASVSEACERLGLTEPGYASPAASESDLPEDPDREEWASISGDVVSGAENAAFAAGLHHHAAAELDDIEHELAAIAALIDRTG